MNPTRRTAFPLVLVLGWAVPVAGQQALQESPIDPSTFRVPIHTSAPDPVGGEYGIWAVGPGYKASFHDGFAFYPFLGPDAPRHLPLRWSTESIRVGGRELATVKPEETWTDWRFERRHAGVIEAYDVREDGVEQTFTLLRRPRAAGDLVVTGRVRSPLTAARLTDAHEELVFRDGAEPVIRYGRAWAIDAAGRKVPMTTGFDGERIRLRLGSAFLESAAYPLTVDPLTSAVQLNVGAVLDLTITADAQVLPKVLFGYSYHVVGNDIDAVAFVADPDYSNRVAVYADAAHWHTPRISACHVGGSGHWAIGSERRTAPGISWMTVYLHGTRSPGLNSGTFPSVASPPSGSFHHSPEFGGSMSGSHALLVFQQQTGSAQTVRGIRVDAARGIAHPPSPVVNFGQPVFENFTEPDVNELATNPADWIVTFVGRDLLRNVHRVRASWVNSDGTVTQPTRSLYATTSGRVAFQPRVAGAAGRYLVTFGTRGTTVPTIDRLHAIRLDWTPSGTVTVQNRRVLAQQTSTSTTAAIRNDAVSHDYLTRSHWALSYSFVTGRNASTLVSRTGFSGAPTETRTLGSTRAVADVSFSRAGSVGQFQVVDAGSNWPFVPPLYGRRLVYPSGAFSASYGTSCAQSGILIDADRPYAGSEFFEVRLTGLPPQTLAFYLLSFTPDNTSLTPAGMPGCFRNVRLPALATFWDVAGAGGTAAVSYPLPDDPLITGDVYSQWFWLAPGANPAGILAHYGVRHQIR